MNHNPADVLYDVIVQSMTYDTRGKYSTPGSVVLKQSEEIRSVLQNLTSDDIKDVRHPNM